MYDVRTYRSRFATSIDRDRRAPANRCGVATFAGIITAINHPWRIALWARVMRALPWARGRASNGEYNPECREKGERRGRLRTRRGSAPDRHRGESRRNALAGEKERKPTDILVSSGFETDISLAGPLTLAPALARRDLTAFSRLRRASLARTTTRSRHPGSLLYTCAQADPISGTRTTTMLMLAGLFHQSTPACPTKLRARRSHCSSVVYH